MVSCYSGTVGVGKHFGQGGKEPGLWAGVIEEARKKGWGEACPKLKERTGLIRKAWPVRQAGTLRGHLSEGGMGAAVRVGWPSCQVWEPIGRCSSHELQIDLPPLNSLSEDRYSFPFLGILMTVCWMLHEYSYRDQSSPGFW